MLGLHGVSRVGTRASMITLISFIRRIKCIRSSGDNGDGRIMEDKKKVEK